MFRSPFARTMVLLCLTPMWAWAQSSNELRVQAEITARDAKDPARIGSYHKSYPFDMKADQMFRIDMVSREDGFDPFLRLEDPSGKVVAQDDDGGGFPHARVFYKAKTTGKHKIICTTFGQEMEGAFTLTVLPATEADIKAAARSTPGAPPRPDFTKTPPSHEQIAEVKVKSTDGKHSIQTLAMDYEGRALALTAPPKGFAAPEKNVISEVHVFSPQGKEVAVWKVPFHANAIAAASNGMVFVAGDAKVAQFDRTGNLVTTVGLPHVEKILQDSVGIRKRAEEQIKQQRDSFNQMVKQYRDRVKAIEAKNEADRTDVEKRQLTQNLRILKSYEQTEKFYESQTVDVVVAQITGRLRTINSIAVSSKDVFITCGDAQGYGYSVWRMDHAFQNPKQVLTGLGGCCGQMDVSILGEELLVAENTKHRFARYDRDGKLVGAGGKRGTDTDPQCFGSCCNPMNCCATGDGNIFTAESEGYIKRFSPKGDFLGLVVSAKMTGEGCKNVAFAVSRDESRIYFLDLPGSRFLVMERKK